MGIYNPVAFDENACGPLLDLSNGDCTVSLRTAADTARMVRSQYGVLTIAASVEMYLYSPNGLTSLVGAYLGICDSQASLTAQLGSDAHGWAYCPNDGTLTNAGGVVATWATCVQGDYVTVLAVPMSGQLSWFKNGDLLGTITTTPGVILYYAATISGANPGDLALLANAGQNPVRWPLNTIGWPHVGTGINPFFAGSEPFISATTDLIASQKYKGDISRVTQPPKLARALRFWMWGDSAPSQLSTAANKVQLQLDDPFGFYAQLQQLDIRDQLLNLDRVMTDGTVATGEPLFAGVLDHCEKPTDQTAMLYAYDKVILLQQQPNRPQYPPDADPTAAGKPHPLALGINRTLPGQLFNSTLFYYGCADELIAAVGKGRLNGKEMALGVDYFPLVTGDGFSFPAAPAGKATFETTDFGGTVTTTSTDALAGDGAFGSVVNDGGILTGHSTSSVIVGTGSKTFTIALPAQHGFTPTAPIVVTNAALTATMTGTVTSWNSGTAQLVISVASVTGAGTFVNWNFAGGVNQPHNWSGNGGYFSLIPPNTLWQVTGASPNKTIVTPQVASAVFTLAHNTLMIAAGQSGVLQVGVSIAPYSGPGRDPTSGGPIVINPAQLIVGGIPDIDLLASIQYWNWSKPVSIPTVGTYNIYFQNNSSASMPLTLAWLCNNMVQGTGGITSQLGINKLICVLLPALTTNVALPGPGLERIVQQIICDRGPLTTAEYDNLSARAIDLLTGYQYGTFVSPDETPVLDDILKPVLDSAGCSRYSTRAGAVSIVQMTAPENATTVAGFLTINDQQGPLLPYEDMAENLTTRITGGRNISPYADSDFANMSQGDVPNVVRELLKKPYQWIQTASAALAQRYYKYARNVAPLQSCFDRSADGLAEISRIAKIYGFPRNFYVGPYHSRIGRNFELGQIWNVKNKYISTLATGQQLLLVGIEDAPTEGYSTLVFWGL